MGNIKFTTFDLGDGRAQSNMTIEYFNLSIFSDSWSCLERSFPTADAIVFLVDATDSRRFAKEKAELDVRILFVVLFYLKNCFLFIIVY
jgi:hypothetical protein